MQHVYKKPIRKLYQPGILDRLDCPIRPGTIVRVTASWGPFRAIETTTAPIMRGTCGKGSLQNLPTENLLTATQQLRLKCGCAARNDETATVLGGDSIARGWAYCSKHGDVRYIDGVVNLAAYREARKLERNRD